MPTPSSLTVSIPGWITRQSTACVCEPAWSRLKELAASLHDAQVPRSRQHITQMSTHIDQVLQLAANQPDGRITNTRIQRWGISNYLDFIYNHSSHLHLGPTYPQPFNPNDSVQFGLLSRLVCPTLPDQGGRPIRAITAHPATYEFMTHYARTHYLHSKYAFRGSRVAHFLEALGHGLIVFDADDALTSTLPPTQEA